MHDVIIRLSISVRFTNRSLCLRETQNPKDKEMHDRISPIINSLISISDKSIREINDLVEYISIKKGELITSVGQKNNLEYFMIEGICKSFLTTPDGESITISLFMSNSVLSPSTTRNNQGRLVINIQVLTDVDVATIDAAEFERLMIENLEIRDFGIRY